MRIGIEAQRIFREKRRGMDVVVVELIKKLQEVDHENEYFIFVKEGDNDAVIREKSNFTIVRLDKAPYPYWEQVLLVKAVAQYRIEVLHCTSNTAPLKINIPLVLTLHDIIYLEKLNLTKGSAYQIFGNLYRRWNVPKVVPRAARILTVSAYEKKKIDNHFRLDTKKVVTVYNGVADRFKPVDNESQRLAIRAKYDLPERFIFCLGNTDPRKNVAGMLRAMSILRKQGKLTVNVLFLGIDRNYLSQLIKGIDDPVLLEHALFTGYVPEADLPVLYSLAEIFIYPSLREGFGIPILEAMSCGTPVITSNTSSMPEVAGEAALLIDPYDPEDIARSMDTLLNDPVMQSELSARGLERVRNFSWLNSAKKTLDVYNEIKREIPEKV